MTKYAASSMTAVSPMPASYIHIAKGKRRAAIDARRSFVEGPVSDVLTHQNRAAHGTARATALPDGTGSGVAVPAAYEDRIWLAAQTVARRGRRSLNRELRGSLVAEYDIEHTSRICIAT